MKIESPIQDATMQNLLLCPITQVFTLILKHPSFRNSSYNTSILDVYVCLRS